MVRVVVGTRDGDSDRAARRGGCRNVVSHQGATFRLALTAVCVDQDRAQGACHTAANRGRILKWRLCNRIRGAVGLSQEIVGIAGVVGREAQGDRKRLSPERGVTRGERLTLRYGRVAVECHAGSGRHGIGAGAGDRLRSAIGDQGSTEGRGDTQPT